MNKSVALLVSGFFVGALQAEPVMQEDAAVAIARTSLPDVFGFRPQDVRAFYLNDTREWAIVSCLPSVAIFDSESLKIFNGRALVKVSAMRASIDAKISSQESEFPVAAINSLRLHLKNAAYPIYAILDRVKDKWIIYSCGRSSGNLIATGDSYAELEIATGAVSNVSHIK